jgi:hypothetical protein
MKYGDVRSIAEHRPIGALQRHILVIVQNSDLVANTRTIRISNRRSEGRDKGEVTSRVLEGIIATSPLRSARSSNSAKTLALTDIDEHGHLVLASKSRTSPYRDRTLGRV